MSGLCRELVFLICQFLNEENYKESLHRLESESGVFCNVGYVEELVLKGDWNELEKYLSGFIQIDENRYSVKIMFEIRKQKYLEALEKKDQAKALEILNKDLKVFKAYNEDLFKEMTHLLTLNDIRENEQLAKYSKNEIARGVLVGELKKLIEMNPLLRDKCQFPTVKNSRLRLLVNQSLNWQHELCRNPKSNPEIRTILMDHTCGPPNAYQAQVSAGNQFAGPMIRTGGFQPPFQQPEAQAFFAPALGQGAVNPPPPLTQRPNSGGGLVHAVHNNSNSDSELLLKRPRSFGIPEEIKNLPTSSVPRGVQSNVYSFLPSTDDLPKNVISSINQGSEIKSMDFHPEHQTLLLVGTSTGDIAIWEVGSRLRIAHRSFSVWNIRARSLPLQASLTNVDHPLLVNRVIWSPDGLVLGVAYSKHLVQVYTYRAGHELQDHLEIEAHVGNVSDLAFNIQEQKLFLITCGEDKTIKIWDGVTGTNLHTYEGHNAPVYSLCPHRKAHIQARDRFIFSTSVDGKIKVWLYDDQGSKVDYDAPGYACTRMAYGTDGVRLFSCGSIMDRESYLVEWNDNDGSIKQQYLGLSKQPTGIVQFDTAKRFLAAGDEFCVKFWDIDNTHIIFSTNADGGLPASPCVRFNKSGSLLAVSTCENGVKILGNPDGIRLARNFENQAQARRLARVSSVAGTSLGFPDRSIPVTVVTAPNQDSQNLPNERSRNSDEIQFPIVWKPKEITEPSQLRSLKLPDNLLPVRIVRLMYTVTGSGVLALAYNAVHKLWKWQKTEQNTTGNATADVAPLMWQPSSGILMTNDIRDANMEDTIPCLAISKNNSYVLSASGGKVSLFNLATFKTMTSFMSPLPAVTCLAFHPLDNNIVAVGMSDSSIQIYNVRLDQVSNKLSGHQKTVTALAFSIDKKILVSAGADAQLCIWNTDNWEKQNSKLLKLPFRRGNNPQGETRVQFNPDQTRLLVVHESQVAIFDPLNLDCVLQWVPRQSSGLITDAVYSCDGKLIFVSIEDGSVNILTSIQLRLKCRIGYAAYNPSPSNQSAIRVCANAIAAHPCNPNQLALGLSDGGVYILEPLESDNQWASEPHGENGSGPSTNGSNSVAASSDQP